MQIDSKVNKKALHKYSTSITSLCSSQVELRFPIVVVLSEYADDDFVAEWSYFSAPGNSITSALENLTELIIDSFFLVKRVENPDLKGQGLKQKITLFHAISEKVNVIDICILFSEESKKYDVCVFLVGENGYESVPGYEQVILKDSKKEAILEACDLAEVLFWDKLNLSKVHVLSEKDKLFSFDSALEAEAKKASLLSCDCCMDEVLKSEKENE